MLALDDSRAPAPSRAPFNARLVVGLALALLMWGSFVCAAAHYEVHDADSRLYAALSDDLCKTPLGRWCAPQWGGHWGRVGLFVEHPPGLFVLAAGLGRLGLSPFVALYVVNQMAWLVGLWALYALARAMANARVAVWAVGLWAVSPAFVQYLVRGDQEHPLAMSLLLGLLAVVVCERPRHLALGFGGALSLAWAFKGLPALGLVPLGALVLIQRRRSASHLIAVAFGTALAALVVALFELWYQTQTGASFLRAYLNAQVAPSVGRHLVWSHKAHNLLYYLARPLWFAQPATALLIYGARQKRTGARKTDAPHNRDAYVLGLCALALFVLAFAMADRKADRYLFGIYPLVALSAAAQCVERSAPARRFADTCLSHARLACITASLVLAGGIGVKVYIGTYHYVFVRIWPGA